MAFVTSTSFSILLNGAPSRTFTPSRGLRQGDPLSPFLFILMMEGLGRAIKMANAKGRIQGIKLTTDGEANTHQQFVDETMLQGIPTVKEAKAIKSILNDFAMEAGTEVSLNKSNFFSLTLILLFGETLLEFLDSKENRYLPNILAFLLLTNC